MWLYNHRVARNEAGIHTRNGIPYREGRAANYKTNTTADSLPFLIYLDRKLAHRLFPFCFRRELFQSLVTNRDSFQCAVAGMRSAGLEGHHKGLTRGMHRAICDIEETVLNSFETVNQHGST